jgi:hypothetical protein
MKKLIVGLLTIVLNTAPLAIAANTMQVLLDETPTIALAQGQGVTITFIPTNRIIEKVWLDNPAWVTLDVDGCLEGLGSSKCEQSGATSIHLRRIAPLSIPGLALAESSLLTVVSRDQQGDLAISTFKLVTGATGQPSVVMVVDEINQLKSAIDITAVRRGRDVAIAQGLMHEGDALCQKIDQFLNLFPTQSVDVAARRVGISQALIQRLNELGSREWGVGSREERVGNRESGVGNRQ